MQKLFKTFQQNYLRIPDINFRHFIETLSNDIVSFEQPGPENLEISVVLDKL